MVKKKRELSKKRGTPTSKVSSKRKKEEMERAQVWSIDVLLAVVIFVSIILIFYVTMSDRGKPRLKDLEVEATDLKIELEKNPEVGFISEDVVDMEKLKVFTNNATYDYEGLKSKLGLRGDFCIFYEDSDGNIIPIGNKTSIGNPAILINGTPCGSDI
ncbi:hypothetical protein KY348_04225 [Candidatus Woesearchaeota archaeon]|nr:hypothetical protein [Candidatus Woesearchaeota archaeon]